MGPGKEKRVSNAPSAHRSTSKDHSHHRSIFGTVNQNPAGKSMHPEPRDRHEVLGRQAELAKHLVFKYLDLDAIRQAWRVEDARTSMPGVCWRCWRRVMGLTR